MRAEPIGLSESVVGSTRVISVSGEVDMYSAPELRAALDALIGERVTQVVVDLSDASFLDSAGIFILLTAKNQLDAYDGTLRVVCPPGAIHRTLKISGALKALGVTDRVQPVPRDAS